MTDTIVALASGGGRSAVAVVRLSGPLSGVTLDRLAGGRPPARQAALRRLRDPATDTPLDRALVLWFPAPASFSGEDCAELHLHGGRAVVAATLATLVALPGCRLALPGEFTRRAFVNGKMDLGEVEGLADLIDADTEAQRRQALRQLDGALGDWVATQRLLLIDALAAAESAIDFSDEGDVAGDFAAEVAGKAAALHDAVRAEIGRSAAAERLREGFVVVIAGPPNAGKSTLLNALARRDVAIVSPHAGTTRDAIAVDLDLGGTPVQIVDTAGLRETADPVEREGIARTLVRSRSADLVLWLSEAEAPCPPDPALGSARVLRVVTKIDLAPSGRGEIAVSARTGAGMDALLEVIRSAAQEGTAGAEQAVATRLRHRDALTRAEVLLAQLCADKGAIGLEIVADELRRVALMLDSLVARIDTEDVLGAIFARFCVGK